MKNCAHVPFSQCIPTINYVGWRVEVVENKEFPYNTLFWRLVPLFTDKESRYDSKQLVDLLFCFGYNDVQVNSDKKEIILYP